ncbi:DnaJ domain-containing protein [Nemania abortiva]|nr:DnaJ domain-containing protein [Nemania abortiva]
MSSVDLYKVLNVSSKADVATIQKAFKDLSLKLHPDKANISTTPPGGTETKAEREAREQRNHEQFIKVLEARDILTDPKTRQAYDYQRRAKKHSAKTCEHRKFGKHSEAGKRENERPSRSTARQGTRVNRGEKSVTIQRLECAILMLRRTFSEFCDLEPRPQSSRSYPEYLEVVSFFDILIPRTARLRDRVRDISEGSEWHSAKAVAEAHMESVNELVTMVNSLMVMGISRSTLYGTVSNICVNYMRKHGTHI